MIESPPGPVGARDFGDRERPRSLLSRLGLPSWSRPGGSIAAARLADALARFLLFLATARVLAPSDFSTYALLTAALATCQWALALGAPRVALYFHARGARGGLYAWLYALAGIASAAVALAVLLLPFLRRTFFPAVPMRWIWLGLAPLPFSLLADSLSAVLIAGGRTRAYGAALWTRNAGTAIVLTASLATHDRLSWILAGRVVVQAATAILLAAFAKARPRWSEVAPFSGQALRYGVPTAASDALITLHRRADVFLLSAFGRQREIGAYALSYAIAEAFWLLTDSFEAALFVNLAEKDRAEAAAAARRSFRLYRLIGAAGLVGGIAGGELLLAIGFRDRYPAAPLLLPWLVAAAVVWGMSRPFFSYLAARGALRAVVACHSIGLAVNVVANVLLIPRSGATGAAVACLTSYAVESVLFAVMFRRVAGQNVGSESSVSKS